MSNIPDIRFKGFTERWEQHKVGDFTSVLSASRVHKDEWESDGIPFFRSSDVVSAFKGVDNDRAYISQDLYEKLIRSSGKLEEGDILITGGGSIGIPYIVPDNAPLYTKDADLIWIKKSSNHNSRYLYTYFTGMQFRDYISSISHVGTIAHYTIEQVKDTPVLMPKMAEQKAIGNFLLHIDYLITLHQRKCDEMSELKKFMLQKMFPKNGELFPEIRFDTFTEPWEQRKFRDVFSGLQNNTLSRAELSYESGEVRNVHYGDVLIKFGEYIDVSNQELPFISDDKIIDKYRSSLLQDGDIIIADTAEDSTVGKCTEIVSSQGVDLISGLHTIPCRPVEKFASKFMGYYMNSSSYHDQLIPLMQGIKVTSISKSALQDTDILHPKSYDEQAKIGVYFSNLDTLITLHQRKCDELKDFKKFMLQNMFPKKG